MKVTIYINQKHVNALYDFLSEEMMTIRKDIGIMLKNKWSFERSETHNVQVQISYWEYAILQDFRNEQMDTPAQSSE